MSDSAINANIPKGQMVRDLSGFVSHVILGGDAIQRDKTGFRYMPAREAKGLTITALAKMIKQHRLYYPPEGRAE